MRNSEHILTQNKPQAGFELDDPDCNPERDSNSGPSGEFLLDFKTDALSHSATTAEILHI